MPVTFRRSFFWLVLTTLLFTAAVGICNQYDANEQTKRDAQRLVDVDKAEREAAERRYDNAHPSGGGFSAYQSAWLIVFIGGVAFIFLAPPILEKIEPLILRFRKTETNPNGPQYRHFHVEATSDSEEAAFALAKSKLPANVTIIRTTYNGRGKGKSSLHEGKCNCWIFYKNSEPNQVAFAPRKSV